jgi:hypothetical protein
LNWVCFKSGHAGEATALRGYALGDLTDGTANFRAVHYLPAGSATLQLVNVFIVWE